MLTRRCASPQEADWCWQNRTVLMEAAGESEIQILVTVAGHDLAFRATISSKSASQTTSVIAVSATHTASDSVSASSALNESRPITTDFRRRMRVSSFDG